MKVKINGRDIKLNKQDVAVAQKLVNSFIESVRDNAVTHNKLQMYLTTIVVMHNTSGDVLRTIDPSVMQAISGKGDEEDG